MHGVGPNPVSDGRTDVAAAPEGVASPPEIFGRTAKPIPTSPRWYVARHTAHDARVALQFIRRLGFDAFWPLEEVLRRKRDSELKPILPGYLFVRFDAGRDPWGKIKHQPCVLGVLCSAQGTPLPLPIGVAENMIEAAGGLNGVILASVPLPTRAVKIDVGAGLRVTSGPFAGRDAIMRADHGDRVDVLMKLLGAEPVVRLSRDQVAVKD